MAKKIFSDIDGLKNDLRGYKYSPQTGNFFRNRKPEYGKQGVITRVSANGYLIFSSASGSSKEKKVHRTAIEIILDTKLNSDQHIDHINGKKTDNRLSNLRILDNRRNCSNRHYHRAGKLVGASYYKRTGRYRSTIKINSKQTTIGWFDSEMEAHLAYVKFRDENKL